MILRRAALSLLLLIPGACWAQNFGLTRIDPSSTIASATDTTLNVYGQNFAPGATINWNGQAQSTTFVSQGQLTATINTPKFATPGAAQVTVTQGGITSTPLTFQILTPMADVKSYTPTVFTYGTDTTITVYGQGFNPNATVFFDWFPLIAPYGHTTFVSSSVLSAFVTSFAILSSGLHHITVYNATPPAGRASLNIQPLIGFGNLPTSTTSTQTITIANISPSTVTFSTPFQVISGTNAGDFAFVGGGTCANGGTLALGASCTAMFSFTPSVQGNEQAVIAIQSNGIGNPQFVTLFGSGTIPAAPAVQLSPTSLSFGNVVQSTTSTFINSTLTNTGTAGLSITGIALTGTNSADFTLGSSGYCTSSTTLVPGASCIIGATFTPSTTSTESASVSITDSAIGSVRTIALTGSGIATASHYVTLSWTASTSASLIGYNVYRGTVSGGPYTLLTPTPVAGPGYTDSAVTHGTTYYYVFTSVGSNPPYSPTESVNSAEVNATP